MIKLGIIGLGRMGGYHASVCSQLNSINFFAVADPSEQAWDKVKKPDVLKSPDYTQWIDSVDAVIIALPTELHYPVAKDCLLRRKHVLVEKPLTKTIDQATELFSIADQNNVVLHVGHVERFNGAVQELKKILDTPYLIECHRMGPFDPRVQNDSVVLDLMIHDLDIVINMVNSPIKKLSAHGTKVHSQNCDIASVQLTFENGVIANIISSRASQIKKRTMAIHQQNEFILLDFATQDITIHRQANSSVQVGADQVKYKQASIIEHLFIYKDNPLKHEIEHFINAIKTQENMHNQEQDIVALKVVFEIEKQLGLRGI
ncbi:MAG: Gfo/Idh/MocA family oxidoreductase [bacterium]